MDIAANIARIRANIEEAARRAGRNPADITLEAATKTQSAETVKAAIAAGITVCGENRVQELTQKLDQFAYDGARVHFIGHLQTNKLRQVVGRVELIESVDSFHLLEGISDYAQRLGRTQDILLEVNIGGEESKSGFRPQEVLEAAQRAAALPGVSLRGLMCVPPVAVAPGGNKKFFREIFHLFVDIRTKIGDNGKDVNCLSMGMSGDYQDAVAEGSTLVRVGSGIFGPRG